MSISATGRGVATLLIATTMVAGCSFGGTSAAETVRPAIPVTAIPSGTADPRVSAAISAYKLFIRTSNQAQRKPVGNGAYPDNANFTRYSFDPTQAQYEAFVSSLVTTHHAFRGNPPRSTITVTSLDLARRPDPVITLADCQAGDDTWVARDTRTNTPDPDMVPVIPAPYGFEIVMAYTRQHWGVQTIRPDPEGTCAR